MKSNNQTCSQQLLKQRIADLVKAGDEMRYICHRFANQIANNPSKDETNDKIDEWDAAKKPFAKP